MIRPSLIRLFLIFACAALPLAFAQTETVADPNVPGGSIIEVITTDINGLPVTNIAGSIPAGGVATPAAPGAATTPSPLSPVAGSSTLSTLTSSSTRSATSSRTSTTAVAAPVGPGPVAQPAPTVPVGEGVTSYQYTTVDAAGETTVIQDIFTPTYNTPSPPTTPSQGTVLGIGAWSSLIGTNTAGGPTNSGETWRITRAGAGGLVALACGLAAGAIAVL